MYWVKNLDVATTEREEYEACENIHALRTLLAANILKEIDQLRDRVLTLSQIRGKILISTSEEQIIKYLPQNWGK